MNSALHAFLTPGKNSTISNIIGWFDDEIKALPATIVKVNKNFVCYAIVGVLRMLYDSSSEYLEGLQSVMASWDASTLEDLLPELSKLIGRIVKTWWAEPGLPEAVSGLHRELEVSIFSTSCDALAFYVDARLTYAFLGS
jgi:hypothetical protein